MACYILRNWKEMERNRKKWEEIGRYNPKERKMYSFSNPEDKSDIFSATLKTDGFTVEASGLAEHFTDEATLKTQNLKVAPTLRTEIFICPRHGLR